jgi:hypothetical protein
MRIKILRKVRFWPSRAVYLIVAVIIATNSYLLWWRPARVHAQTDTFTVSGTWNVPANVSSADFEAWGGGGAGGGANSVNMSGSGGAGGQYAIKTLSGLVTNDAYTVTVATSVAGGTGNGTAGNDSQVTNPSSTVIVRAKGGAGGTANNGSGGAGSTANGIGDVIRAGGNGANGCSGCGNSGGGGGGAGSTGAGGNASGTTAGIGTANNGGNGGAGISAKGVGNSGNNYGGAGSGGNNQFGGGNNAAGGGAAGLVTVTYTVVIPNSAPAAPDADSPSMGGAAALSPQFRLTTSDADSDYVNYEIQVCSTSNCSAVIYTACQVAGLPNTCTVTSQTGWSGQNANSGLAYASSTSTANSTQAVYDYQGSPLSPNTQYWWRAYTIDPAGSNTASGASAIQTFTTASLPSAPSLNSPSSGATGVSVSPSFNLSSTDSTSTWSQTGNSLTISSVGAPALAKLSSSRVAFVDGGNKQLRTYDFDGTTWSQTGNSLTIPSTGAFPALASLSSTRVAFIDGTNQQLRTYDFDGTNWSQTGNSLSIPISGVRYRLAGLTSSQVVYHDDTNQQIRTYSFDGTNWSQVGNSLSSNGSGGALAALSSTRATYISSSLEVIRVYDFDGTNWTQVGSNNRIYTTSSAGMAALSGSRIALIDLANDMLRTFDFGGTSWTQSGMSLSVASNGVPALASLSGTRVAFIDGTNQELRTYDFTNAPLKYRISLYQSDCSTAEGSSPFNQSSSGTGWDNGTAAYASGAAATYTYQSALASGTQYCWKADAIDPTGSNSYSAASATQLFTTAVGPVNTVEIQGGVDIRGGTTLQ